MSTDGADRDRRRMRAERVQPGESPQRAGVFDACSADGVPYVPYFPLGSAFLADNPVLARRPW